MSPTHPIEEIEDLHLVDERVTEAQEVLATQSVERVLEPLSLPARRQRAAQQRLGLAHAKALDQLGEPFTGRHRIGSGVDRLGCRSRFAAHVLVTRRGHELHQRPDRVDTGEARKHAQHVGRDRQRVAGSVLGPLGVEGGRVRDELFTRHSRGQQAQHVARDLAHAIVEQAVVEALEQSGDGRARIGVGQIDLDVPLDHARGIRANRFVARQALPAPQIEGKVVPGTQQQVARLMALSEWVPLVGAAVVDRVHGVDLGAKDRQLLARGLQHSRAAHRYGVDRKRARPLGRGLRAVARGLGSTAFASIGFASTGFDGGSCAHRALSLFARCVLSVPMRRRTVPVQLRALSQERSVTKDNTFVIQIVKALLAKSALAPKLLQ